MTVGRIKEQLKDIAHGMCDICQEETHIEGCLNTNAETYIGNEATQRIMEYLVELKIPLYCPDCQDYQLSYANDNFAICFNCGKVYDLDRYITKEKN